MKLIEMKIKNFRSLVGENVVFSLSGSDILFIFGQNNAGKSSILTAYEYLVNPKQKVTLSDFAGFSTSQPIEIYATFEKEDEDDVEFEKKGFLKWVAEDKTIKFRKSWDAADIEGMKATYEPSTKQYQNNGFGGIEPHFTKQAPTALRIPAFPTVKDLSDFVNDVMKKEVLKNLKNDERALYSEIQIKIEEIKEKLLSNSSISSKEELANRHFQKLFPDLTIEINQVEGNEFNLASALEKEYSIIIRDSQYPEIKQSFSNHGHGAIRQAMFNILCLVTGYQSIGGNGTKKEYIILFEEPEVYLHPKSIRLLRETLYELCSNSPFQIICVSHNPQLIDLSKPHISLIRLFKNQDNNSILRQVNRDLYADTAEEKERVQMINRFNPDVCESFFADEVIMVEGDTEAIVVRELLSRCDPSRDVYVVNTGSKTNMPFYQKIFTHFRIKHHVIHDSDCRFCYTTDKETGKLVRSKNDNGQDKASPSWSLNQRIWDEILTAQAIDVNLADRYVSIHNFEEANHYTYNANLGKPLSAYRWVTQEQNLAAKKIFEFVNCIIGRSERTSLYTQEELENIVTEPDEIE